jgi:hypothetical protein
MNNRKLGKYQRKMWIFLCKNPRLQGIAMNNHDTKIAKSLAEKGFITLNEFNQAEITEAGLSFWNFEGCPNE